MSKDSLYHEEAWRGFLLKKTRSVVMAEYHRRYREAGGIFGGFEEAARWLRSNRFFQLACRRWASALLREGLNISEVSAVVGISERSVYRVRSGISKSRRRERDKRDARVYSWSDRGYSQREISRFSGIPRSTVYRILRRRNM